MNPTNKPLIIQLNGERHTLLFDLNTFTAFEEASGKFFFDFLAGLQESLQAFTQRGKDVQVNMLEVLRKVSLKDLHTLLWAAMHEYKGKEVVWPRSRAQIGQMVDISNLADILPQVMSANAENGPEKDETVHPTDPRVLDFHPASGGRASGPSDAEILDSLTTRSED